MDADSEWENMGGEAPPQTGRKTSRHTKIQTAKGMKDRRVRLSAYTAIKLYDLQDRLGYDRPSKAVDWLIGKAKFAIEKLNDSPPTPSCAPIARGFEYGSLELKPGTGPSSSFPACGDFRLANPLISPSTTSFQSENLALSLDASSIQGHYGDSRNGCLVNPMDISYPPPEYFAHREITLHPSTLEGHQWSQRMTVPADQEDLQAWGCGGFQYPSQMYGGNKDEGNRS